MKDNDSVCFDQEECFQIKYLQFKCDLDFTIEFRQKDPKQNIALSCTIHQTSHHVKYHQVHSVQTLSLKSYFINKMQPKGQKSARKGSEITENENLCLKYYESV